MLLSSSPQTALDAYVHAPDPTYHYSLASTLTGSGYTDYVLNLTSQTWRSTADVNQPVWQHWLQVIVPSTVKSNTAILDIGGGSTTSSPPTSADGTGVFAATSTGAITVVLPDVPNEPLTFTGKPAYTEDQIVAYSFEQYLNGGDQNWPVLLPMVNSAVKAMDATQSFVASQSGGSLAVNNFIVSGASKRGWTTWLTPAVDNRVVAIVPFVFEFVNQAEQVPNLKDTYVGVTQHIVGGFPDAVQDYTNDGVFASYGTPQGTALTQIVDPFTYISRPTYNIPKYMIGSTGDQFFVPDSAQFYFGSLPGQNYLRYVPNTDHGLNFDALQGAVNFEKALLDGAALPRFSWTVTNGGTAINLHTIDAPASVTMWQATNPNSRDFRLETFGANWTSSTLTDQGGGNYVASVGVPPTGATSFFIQLTYNVDGVTLTFTTQISTVPLFTPSVAAADAGGTYNGNPFPATGTATGVSGYPVPGTFAYTYYNGSTASGTGTSTPPTNPGIYTVVASFTSTNPEYVNGQSAPVTFTVSPFQLSGGVLTIQGGSGDDTISIVRADSGALDVTVDGVQQHYNAGTVSSIVVDGGAGNDSLTVDDSSTASGQTYTLTATQILRAGSQPITYSNIETETLDAGNQGNTVDWQGSSYGVFYLYTGTGTNTINFGDANNTLNSFAGAPVVEGQGSSNTVNVFDQGNTTTRHYVLTANSLSPNGGQGFGYGVDIQTANVYLGSGGNTVDWQGVAAGETVTVHAGAGTNTVNFGDANNTLDGFQGTPILVGQGNTTANVNDQGSTNPHTYVITPTSLTRDGGTGYLNGLVATNYRLGSGGNTIDWQGTAAGDTTTVYTGAGTNTINVGGGGNTLDEFQGTPVLVGQGSHNTANYFDQGGSAAFWSGFGGNAQHTAISPTGGQPLTGVSWQTPVDLQPQYSGSELLIHYGEPAVTKGNTLIIPVKTGASGGFEIAAVDGYSGAVRWTIPTDWILPNHGWTPSFAPVMTASGRVYFAGAGGTVYYFDNPDSPTAPVVHQLAFYGLSNYQANAAAFNGSVFVDTPLTADANGDIFFGFRVQGTAPAPLNTTQSGYARIDASGNGSSVLVGAMTGDANITRDSHDAAPALSNDGKTLYVVAKATSTSYYGYLVALDATTPMLATKSEVFLRDPRNGNGAGILDDGTSSPLVAPDGTVFLGVFGNPYNGSRGFTLHFDATLATQYTPAAFGWDDTGSIVRASMVPGYTGTSSYLLFLKYNNYAGTGSQFAWGDGVNKIAILDPNATQLDNRNDGAPTMQVMKEVMTATGPTPDADFISQGFPNAVHEWCINSTVIDPTTDAIYANSEDGKLYRWDLASNSLTQPVTLTAGLGEAYTPTWMGPDGRVYAINNATLFSVGITGWGGHNGAQFSSPTYSTAATAAGSTAPHTYVLTGSSIARDGFAFSYSGLQSLNLYGGSGGNTINWQGTAANSTTTVYTGTGTNVINFGDANNTLDGFQGTPILQGQGSNNTDNIFDQGSTNPHTYVLTSTSLSRDGGTGYGYDLQAVNFHAGSAGNVIDWQGTSAAPTAVYTGTGVNTINFGNANNTLDSFVAIPTLFGQGSHNTVNVYDQGSTSKHTYVITATSFSRDGGIGYGYDIQAANYYLGSGGNVVDWQGTASGITATLYTGTGTNTVNFGDTNNTLDGFQGTPIVQGQGSNNTVNVHDDGSTAPHTYVLTGTSLTRDGGTGYGYDLQAVNFYAGSGGNTIDWQGTAAGSTTTVYTGTGVNTINFGDANNTLDGFLGTPILQGQGSNNTVNVHDDGSTAPHTYVITANSLTRDGGTGYGYGTGFVAVNYYFGSGGNTIDWQGDGAPTTVHTGTGTNVVNFGDANNTLGGFAYPITLDGQGSNNTVNVHDEGTTSPRHYVLGAPDSATASFSIDGGNSFSYGSDVQAANFYLGSGGNTVDWQGTPSGMVETVYTGAGVNTVNFGDANNTLNAFYGTPILQGQGSNNTVNVFDQGTTAARHYVITATAFSPNGGAGFGYGYDIQAANYYLGSGGNTVDWQGTAAGITATLYTGTGVNTINFGDANNTLDGFQGTPVVHGQGANNTVNLHDQGSTAPHTYVLTPNSVSRDGVTGSGSDIQAVNLYAGSGGNVIDWQGAATPTTVYTGTGVNTVNVGDVNNTLDGFTATPTLVGQGTNNTVNVYDQGSTAAHAYVLTGSSLSRDGGTGYYSGVQTANVYLGTGGNTLDWQGTSANTTVYTGTGVNTINFGDANNTLDGFQGTPILQGQGSNNTVNVFDQGSTAAHAYVVTNTSLSRDGGTGYGYDIQAANYHFGTGANTVNWQASSSSAAPITADFAGGSDQVQGAYSAAATRVNGDVVMTGSAPALGALTVTTQGTLDLSQAAAGTVAAVSVNNQGSVIGSGHLALADAGDFASGNLSLVLGGTTAGTTYDQVQVGGTATLSGSLALSLVPGFVPAAGQTFTIVHDTAGNPVGGTFTGLPGGTLIHVSGVDGSNHPFTAIFQISYAGGDVVLTDVAAPQVSADHATVTVIVGQTATNTGTWSQPGFAGADTITASVGTITQTGGNGSGTWSWSFPTSSTSQSQTVTVYANDGQGDVASTTFTLTVNPDPTTTAVASSVNPSYQGQSVTFTATITPSVAESFAASGTVTFKDGTNVLGTGTVSGNTATFTTSGLSTGTHSVTAVYGGDAQFVGSGSGALSQAVRAFGSSTALTSSANPSVFGQTVTFTATVTHLSGTLTPTGTVTFLDGTTALGTANLNSGVAHFNYGGLGLGGHSITAVYGGNTSFAGSTSAPVAQAVNQSASTTTVKSSANASVFGQSVTFTATVKAGSPGKGTPTGGVTFFDGTMMLGTGTLNGSGQATFTTSTLSVGSHPITVSYGGDADFTGSTSSTMPQSVNRASTTTVVMSSLNPSSFGQSVTFTATVAATAPGSGTPTGTVTFKDGSKTLGTGTLNAAGQATFTTSTLAVGNHSITAVYATSTSYKGSTSSALTQTVNPAAAVVKSGTWTPGSTDATLALFGKVGTPAGTSATTNGMTVASSTFGAGLAQGGAGLLFNTDTSSLSRSGVAGSGGEVANVAALDRLFAATGKDPLTGEGDDA